MSGRADGKGTFVVRPTPKGNEPAVEGNLNLSAPDLLGPGRRRRRGSRPSCRSRGATCDYDLFAESLGGKIKFTGIDPPDRPPRRRRGAGGQGLGPGCGVPRSKGSGPRWASAGRWRSSTAWRRSTPTSSRIATGSDLRARGLAEVRDLRWGDAFPDRRPEGDDHFHRPQSWRIDPLSGDVLGGSARGSVVSDRPASGPRHLKFDLEIDRASLKRSLAFIPALASKLDGVGTLRLAGPARRRASAPTASSRSRRPGSFGLPLHELRAPGELEYAPGGGLGTPARPPLDRPVRRGPAHGRRPLRVRASIRRSRSRPTRGDRPGEPRSAS